MPNYQVRTDTPVVEIRIDGQYYEIVSDYAINISRNRFTISGKEDQNIVILIEK